VIAHRDGRRFFAHIGSLPSSVASILAAIADVLASVADIFQSIAPAAIVRRVASILEAIATVFAAVANVLQTITDLSSWTLRRLCGHWHQQCHEESDADSGVHVPHCEYPPQALDS
jgi:hypothetical protein